MFCQLFSEDGRGPSNGETDGTLAGAASCIIPGQSWYEDARGPSEKAANGAPATAAMITAA